MEQTFKNGVENHKRPIKIKIDNGWITFHFPNEGDREFYYIDVNEWISDKTETRQGREDNWHNHMKEKNWFTQEMADFINLNAANY